MGEQKHIFKKSLYIHFGLMTQLKGYIIAIETFLVPRVICFEFLQMSIPSF